MRYAIIVWDEEAREYSVATEDRYDTEEEGAAAVAEMIDGRHYRVSARCPECDGKLIGCDHPYCPTCREAAIQKRRAKSAASVGRRCRDCGAHGPVDARGLGWNCGCASE